MAENYTVEMVDISKSFGGVHALKDVTVRFKPGTVHSLVGENGAGKSTLIKILSGAYSRDQGDIIIEGKAVYPKSTFEMKREGIGVIYQEFALAQECSVAENIFINKLSGDRKKGFIDWKELNSRAKKLINSIGFDIDPTTIVGNLSVAYQQVIEITKALSNDVKVLVLDEPTAVLSPNETKKLFDILAKLKSEGVAIIYISHRLEDVMNLSDEMTVLRDGEVKANFKRGEVGIDQLVAEMIGRSPDTFYPERKGVTIGEEVLRVENLNKGYKVQDVSFNVHKGEVLGIAGLLGSGKTETARLIFGADKGDNPPDIYVGGEKVKIRSPYDAMKKGINYLSESRKDDGVLLDLPIEENITISDIGSICKGKIFLNKQIENKVVSEHVTKYTVKCGKVTDPVSSLSGGNQQKVSIAKTLYTDTKVVFLDEPTRGVDVGAKVEIYNIINEMVQNGLAVVFVSSEIEEIVGMCDRVIVIGQGKVMGELNKNEISKEKIVTASAGVIS